MERAYREISNSRYRERFNIACSCLTRQSHDYPHGTWGVKGKLSVSLALPRRRRFSHVMLYFASGMARSQCRFTRFPVPSSFPLLSHSFSPIHTLFSPPYPSTLWQFAIQEDDNEGTGHFRSFSLSFLANERVQQFAVDDVVPFLPSASIHASLLSSP